MPRTKYVLKTDWEDCSVAGIHELVCSCGTTVLKESTVSADKIVECPNCSAKYQFTWIGMTIKRVKPGKPKAHWKGE